MQWLAIARLVIMLWPILKEIVAKIEEAFPQSGIGTSTKLPAAMNMVESIVQAMGDIGVSFEAAAPAIKSAIGALVALSKVAPSSPSSSTAPAA